MKYVVSIGEGHLQIMHWDFTAASEIHDLQYIVKPSVEENILSESIETMRLRISLTSVSTKPYDLLYHISIF